MPANVKDVAAYILSKHGKMTAMKLQKLVYYSQAWHLVWEDEPLFSERIEAWANGPVCPDLYNTHRNQFEVFPGEIHGSPDNLTPAMKESIDSVLRFYGDKTSHWLSGLTHAEAPWKDTRLGIPPGERSDREITLASMAEYYGGL